MKFLSVDLETTGQNPLEHDILEVAMVLYDTSVEVTGEEPFYHTFVRSTKQIWEPGTLMFHLPRMAYFYHGCQNSPITRSMLATDMRKWLDGLFGVNGRPTVAGKNFGSFDLGFLRRMPGWTNMFSSRILDLGPLCLEPGDTGVPDSANCFARCGLGAVVAHTALEDARRVGQAVLSRLKLRGILT